MIDILYNAFDMTMGWLFNFAFFGLFFIFFASLGKPGKEMNITIKQLCLYGLLIFLLLMLISMLRIK